MIKKASLLLILVTLILSCAALEDLVQKPSVAFSTVDIKEMSFSGATLEFLFKVNNPNPLGFTISKAAYDLRLNQQAFLKGDLEKGISLPASGQAPLAIPFSIDYFEFFKSVQNFLKEDSLDYDLSGNVAVGPFTVPYSVVGKFAVPRLPEISLKDVQVEDLSLSGASLNFALDVKNRNSYAVNIEDIEYNIALGAVSIASGKTEKLNPVSGGEAQRINIPLKVSFVDLGLSVYQMLTGGNTDYELSGNIGFDLNRAGVKQFPFSTRGKVQLKK